VFTGGRKLYESKSQFHQNCHFYGCGVEWEHFGKALLPETPVVDQLKSLPKPVLGYFGVVDERLDYSLIEELARQNPAWSIAIVGPVMKVDAAALPKCPNLHWLGKQAYGDLPAFAKGFDVCLMPFALNEATEFINPTKALEYMATGRPIVSTPVADVVHNFGAVIQIGHSRPEFLKLCRDACERPDQAAVAAGLEMARENSWERIVAAMERHIAKALSHGRAVAAPVVETLADSQVVAQLQA